MKIKLSPKNRIVRAVQEDVSNHSYNTRKRRREMIKNNIPVEVHIMLDYPTRRRRIQSSVENIKPINNRKRVNILFGLTILCWIWLLDETHQAMVVNWIYDTTDVLMKINWIGLFNMVRTYGIDAVNTAYFIGLNVLDLLGEVVGILENGWTEWVEYVWLLNLNTDWTGIYMSIMSVLCNFGEILHFGVYVGIGIFMGLNV